MLFVVIVDCATCCLAYFHLEQSSLEIVINQNDNALGVFSFTQSQYALNDVDELSTRVTILRQGGTLDSVTVS